MAIIDENDLMGHSSHTLPVNEISNIDPRMLILNQCSGNWGPTRTGNPGSGWKSKKFHWKSAEMAYFRGKKECEKVRTSGNSGGRPMNNAHDPSKNQAQACLKNAFKQSRMQLKQELKPATCALSLYPLINTNFGTILNLRPQRHKSKQVPLAQRLI